jgi:hypothetical protein
MQTSALNKYQKIAQTFTTIAAVLFLSEFAYAGPFGFSPNSYLDYVEQSYLQTTKNFDDNGNTSNLLASNQFTEYKTNIEGAYDFSERFGIYSNLLFKSTDATSFPVERTNTALSDFGLGMSALLWEGFVNIIPEAGFSLPLYPTPGSQAAVLLGDGVFVGAGKIYISKNFKDLSLAVYGGYTYRSQNLSALLPWGALANLTFGDFFLDLRGDGLSSLNTDFYPTSSQARRLLTDNLDGGSYIYDTINPSLVTASARLGFNVANDLFMTAGLEQTIVGQRSAQYTRFIVGIGLTDFLHKTANHKTDSTNNDELQKFEVDTQTEDIALNSDKKDSSSSKRPKNLHSTIPIR